MKITSGAFDELVTPSGINFSSFLKFSFFVSLRISIGITLQISSNSEIELQKFKNIFDVKH